MWSGTAVTELAAHQAPVTGLSILVMLVIAVLVARTGGMARADRARRTRQRKGLSDKTPMKSQPPVRSSLCGATSRADESDSDSRSRRSVGGQTQPVAPHTSSLSVVGRAEDAEVETKVRGGATAAVRRHEDASVIPGTSHDGDLPWE